MDKSKALGFSDVREGDWWVSMKVENDVVWNNYLKTGLIRGFSVEVRAAEKESDELLSKISDILTSNASEEVMLSNISNLLK